MKETRRFLSLAETRWNEGFWSRRCHVNQTVTLHAVYEQFFRSGRIGAILDLGRDENAPVAHVYWDSDVYKWMEAVAYTLGDEPADEQEQASASLLRRRLDELVEALSRNQEESGYLNSHFQRVEQEQRFQGRGNHELYCAGHLMEAAVAMAECMGDQRLLAVACRYADYIESVFITGTASVTPGFATPGHPEIELALLRLYRTTGETRYLSLARHFLNERGRGKDPLTDPVLSPYYAQDHAPLRTQATAEGHAVRAAYLYAAMAELARVDEDEEMLAAGQRLMRHLTQRRMYVTGGIGSAEAGEAFTLDYDLPNLSAYSESCASIGLLFFAERLWLAEAEHTARRAAGEQQPSSAWDDLVERILYNSFLSAVSLRGDAFFYVNPLELCTRLLHRNTALADTTFRLPPTQRKTLFECSCCPPNIARLMASVRQRIYSVDEDGGLLYVHQYMSSEAKTQMGGRRVTLRQSTEYPIHGVVDLLVEGAKGGRLMLRIPSWCSSYQVTVGGIPYNVPCRGGYLPVPCADDVVQVRLSLTLEPRLVVSHPAVRDNAGRVCLMRGPLVYALEGIDQTGDGLPDDDRRGTLNLHALMVGDLSTAACIDHEAFRVPVIDVDGWRPSENESLYRDASEQAYLPTRLRFIPYFAFANRGETDLLVWVRPR